MFWFIKQKYTDFLALTFYGKEEINISSLGFNLNKGMLRNLPQVDLYPTNFLLNPNHHMTNPDSNIQI